MSVLTKIKRAVRGDVKLTTVVREALRRSRASLQQRKERASLDENKPLAFRRPFDRMSPEQRREAMREYRRLQEDPPAAPAPKRRLRLS